MKTARLALASAIALLLFAGACYVNRVEYRAPVVTPSVDDFAGTIWKSRDARTETFRYFKLRDDGQLGYNMDGPRSFTFTGNDTWSLEDGMLILNHDNGDAVEKYPLDEGIQRVMRGRKSSKSYEGSSLVILTLSH
jgi:hypothetical protein